MNKKLLAGAVLVLVAVVASATYVLRGRSEQQALLQYVPADTVVFAGSLGPVDVRKYLEMWQPAAGMVDLTRTELEKFEEAAKGKSPLLRFLTRVYIDYLEQFRAGPDHLIAYYGMGEKAESAVYMVGAIPVARFQLRDPAAFVKAIANAEQKAELTPKLERAGDIEVRRYTIQEAVNDKPNLDLLIATSNNAAVITLDSSKLDEQTRALVLGQEKPAASLARGELASLAKAHALDNDSVFFVDFVTISKSFVDPNSTRLGQHLERMLDDTSKLADIRTPACQTEIPAFVGNVPRLVGGLKNYRATADGTEMSAVYTLEIKNAAVLETLSGMRGVLPNHLLGDDVRPLAWFGLGLDVDAVAPALTRLIQTFGEQTYACEPLLKAQKAVTTQNMAGLLALGLARGVKGLSVAAYTLDFDALKAGSTDGLDVIASLSAADPMVLWQMGARWLPPVTLPKNGDPIDFPLPKGGTVKVALKGNHLVAYVGDKSARAAQQLNAQGLAPNGLFTYGYDYSLFGKLALVANKNPEGVPGMNEMFEHLAGVRFAARSDFVPLGWHTEVVVYLPRTKPKPTT